MITLQTLATIVALCNATEPRFDRIGCIEDIAYCVESGQSVYDCGEYWEPYEFYGDPSEADQSW